MGCLWHELAAVGGVFVEELEHGAEVAEGIVLGCVGVKLDLGEAVVFRCIEGFVEGVEQAFATGNAGAGMLAFTEE